MTYMHTHMPSPHGPSCSALCRPPASLRRRQRPAPRQTSPLSGAARARGQPRPAFLFFSCQYRHTSATFGPVQKAAWQVACRRCSERSRCAKTKDYPSWALSQALMIRCLSGSIAEPASAPRVEEGSKNLPRAGVRARSQARAASNRRRKRCACAQRAQPYPRLIATHSDTHLH